MKRNMTRKFIPMLMVFVLVLTGAVAGLAEAPLGQPAGQGQRGGNREAGGAAPQQGERQASEGEEPPEKPEGDAPPEGLEAKPENGNPNNRGGRRQLQGLIGKVAYTTDTQLVVTLAEMPEMNEPGQMPEGMPQEGMEPPAEGEPAESPPQEDILRELVFSDSQTTYTVADTMLANAEGMESSAISLSDLSAGDIIRIILDGEGLVTAVERVTAG